MLRCPRVRSTAKDHKASRSAAVRPSVARSSTPPQPSACPPQRPVFQEGARNRDTVKEYETGFEDGDDGGRDKALLSEMSGGPRFFDENHFARFSRRHTTSCSMRSTRDTCSFCSHPKCDRWESFAKHVRAQEDNLHCSALIEDSLLMGAALAKSISSGFEETATPSPCLSAKQLGAEDTFATSTMGEQPTMPEVPKHAVRPPVQYAHDISQI